MTGNYLTLLEESLRRKLQVMEEIQKYNMRQQEIFQSGEVDIDKFDEYVAEKGVLIDKLTALDSGFEKLYAKVSEELQGSREQYADQIRTLQGLVTQVTDRSVDIQAQEARNKKLVEDCNQRLEGYQDELLELPREIEQANFKLMLATMDYCYDAMQENGADIQEIAQWVTEVRIELKKRLIRKQEMEQRNNAIYSYMHDVFGAEVIEIFDMKYNPDQRESGTGEE